MSVSPGCRYVCRFILWTFSCGQYPKAPACPATISPGCFVSKPLAHPSLCVRGSRAFVRVCSRAPFRSACVWVSACARSRPRVPLSPARAPRTASWRPVGIPACVPVRLAEGPGAHATAAGPTARRREEGGSGGGGCGVRGHVTETDRRAGGRRRPRVRAGAGAPQPPFHCPRPGEPPPSPGDAEMQFSVQAPRLGGFSGRVLERRGETRRRPKTRFQRCWGAFWTFTLLLLSLHFCLGGWFGEDGNAALSGSWGPRLGGGWIWGKIHLQGADSGDLMGEQGLAAQLKEPPGGKRWSSGTPTFPSSPAFSIQSALNKRL
ncbi:nanos homolog 3 isoform X3 [Manis javanica]|uniref:nanos homolog 3 isoform X3 n=1 Tax=Manis javanica TaxID=9974 RepID=UPI003C6D6C98